MSFAWPHLLWLLLLPAGLLAWELTRRKHRQRAESHPKILRAEIGTTDLTLVREAHGNDAIRVRPWLLAGLAFTLVALARPQWGRIDEPVFDQSREILLAVDLSRSMLSPDVKPSRLERSKLLIQSLLEKLQGERVGLVVFSGTSFLQSPLSADYEILREFLPALGPDFLPEGGTNYRALIDTALDAFGAGTAADRFLIILSDGEATDDDWKSRVDELKKHGIRVIGLGVGTAAGTMIPDGAGGFVKDDRGAVVLSKLESGTLQELASATGGVYRDASAWIDLAGLIDQTVNAGKKGSFEDRTTIRLVERFQWPLALALWCFLVSLYYEFPVRPRSREIALRRGAPVPPGPAKEQVAKAGGAVGLLLFGCLVFHPPPAHAAVTVAPPINSADAVTPKPGEPTTTAPSLLGKVVGRLAAKPTLTDPDLSELAHETLNWGRTLKEGGQPVPEGPVRDALAAVDQLQARGSKLTDWSQLHRDLQALLEKPQEKKPPQQQPKDDQKKDQNQQQQNQPQSKDQKQSDAAQKQDQQNQSGQQKDQQQQDKSGQPKQDQQKPAESAFGDMKQQPPPPAQPQPRPGDTQKVGGAQPDKTPKEQTDPALALPMDKLEQLKDHDSPAELFQLMQPDRSEGTRKKPAKDW